ncbi:MAG: ABC transporter ATP-binding protein [Erysipelothrix sp.]
MDLFLDYIKKYKGAFIGSFLLVGITVVTMLIQPNILSLIINSIVVSDTSTIRYYGMVLIGLAFLGLVAGILNTILASKVSQRIGSDIRESIFSKVQTFSYSNIEKFSASNLVIRLTNDSQQAQNLVVIILMSLMRIPLMFIGSLILAIMTMPQLWWVILLVLVLVILVVMVSFGMMGPKFAKIQHYLENINAIAKENFLGMRVVKSFVQEDAEIQKFNSEGEKLTHEIIVVGYIFSFMIPTFFLIMDGMSAFVIFMIGNMTEIDPAIIGSTVKFISYLVMVMMSLMIGGMMVSFASRAFVSVSRINEVLNTKADMSFNEDGPHLENGSIVFNNVSFTYPGQDSPTLHDISFSINHGETIGVVGATGSGKSTLVQLMARIYDPSSGDIIVGDHPFPLISKSSYHQDISLVLQRPVLFSGTIADTLRQGKENATLDEMVRAAEIAQALEFIEKEPEQFEAKVYQRGANFSGGQKQRLSIARGLIGNPKILILDDSTSALDAHSEKLVREGLIEKLTETTQIIISQKISSIVHADNILVLDDGHLVAQGKHHELIQNSDVYREIFETQKGRDDHENLHPSIDRKEF